MPLPVLTPVERRRRRRRSRRPLLTFALVVLATALAAWHWWPGVSDSTAPPATGVPSVVAAAKAPAGRKVASAAVGQLVTAPRQPAARIVPPLTSRSAIVIDGRTGEVVFWRNPHERLPIASVTKVMTAVLALEQLRPTAIVVVAPLATRVPPNSERLRPGERVEAWKLLYGAMLYSANDSALALGIAVAGSRPRFIALMNEKARSLGLRDTHFNSASGVIDDGNYSSAWDLAALARYAMRNPRFRTIVATKQKRVAWAPPTNWKLYVNHNRLLTTYAGADGIKTGWTTVARHTLAASARRGKVWLIGVTLGSADSFTDMKRILDLGFRLRKA